MSNELPIYKLNLNEARNKMEISAKARTLETINSINDYKIPSPIHSIQAKLFSPKGSDDGLIIYFHGGAFTLNSVHTHEFLMRKLANLSNHKVLGVNFKQSPEYKFPFPLTDCITSIIWVYNNSNKLGFNKEKIYVGGDSSGATLALASSLYLKDINANYIKKIFLLYPPLDNYNPGTASYYDKGNYPVSREFLMWGWDNYLNKNEDLNNKYIFPLRSESFKGLPEILLMFAELDALVDENKELVRRLSEEDVSFEYKCYKNEMHGFMMNENSDAYKDAIKKIVNFVK